jgi:hypothetical protein
LEWPTAASSHFILFTPFFETYSFSTTFSPLGTEKCPVNIGAAALAGSDV